MDYLQSSPVRIGFGLVAGFIVLMIIFNRRSLPSKQINLAREVDTATKRSGETKEEIEPVKMAEPQFRKVGGLGSLREKDPEVQRAVDKILPQLSEKTGKNFVSVEVLSYKPQTVAGKNYFVKGLAKTKEGEEDIVHLRVFQPLGDVEPELSQYQLSKTKEEEIVHFQ